MKNIIKKIRIKFYEIVTQLFYKHEEEELMTRLPRDVYYLPTVGKEIIDEFVNSRYELVRSFNVALYNVFGNKIPYSIYCGVTTEYIEETKTLVFTVTTERPGRLIGGGGSTIDSLKSELSRILDWEKVDIKLVEKRDNIFASTITLY